VFFNRSSKEFQLSILTQILALLAQFQNTALAQDLELCLINGGGWTAILTCIETKLAAVKSANPVDSALGQAIVSKIKAA
jgi:hypothetical protein